MNSSWGCLVDTNNSDYDCKGCRQYQKCKDYQMALLKAKEEGHYFEFVLKNDCVKCIKK